MSALVWSVESAVLGAWALVFSFYSTPFIAFIARSHSLIAGFTLVLQLLSAARDLPIGHAISEAFVCAVTSLMLIFTAALLDKDSHARFFSMPAAGLLPLDAAIGVAWFCAAFVSAMGMALSGVGKMNENGMEHKRKASLMFHQYGYHMSIVLPSFLIIWLYNYDGGDTTEPVHKGIKFMSNNSVTVTHTILFLVYSGIWGCFVILQFLGEGIFTWGKEWPAWGDMTPDNVIFYILSVCFKFIGRSGCVLIPLSAVFVSKNNPQAIMGWVLVGVAGVYAIDLLSVLDRLVGKKREKRVQEDFSPSAPAQDLLGSSFLQEIESEIPIQIIGRNDPKPPLTDPAAVTMRPSDHHADSVLSTTTNQSSRKQQQSWRRDKMV